MSEHDGRTTLALLRLSGEVGTKARMTRQAFVSRLVSNLQDLLRSEGLSGEVERRYDRLFVSLPDGRGTEALARVFGLQAVAPAVREPCEKLEDAVEIGVRRFERLVAGRRFAVRARVVGDRARRPFGRRDLEVALGERLLPASAGVDLTHPEVTARIEVYEGQAYCFEEELRAPGGLPLGTESRAVALVSGGFDSAVAAWQLLRRGVHLDYVFCNLGGTSHQLGTLRVMKEVADRWSYGTRPRLYAVDFDPVTADIQAHAEPRYWQVILKRQMLRTADRIARETGAQAIVTGEAVGQVSSQTLPNLAVISDATRTPILRPLIGANKEDIIAQARAIGTARLSEVVDEYCAMVPRRPATAARLDVVLEQEAAMDPGVLDRAIEGHEALDLRALDPDDSGMPELETREIPAGAVVLDLRHRNDFDAWHWPDAVWLDFPQAMRAYPSFGRDERYVLYCEFGLKSAHLAERMHREGLRVLHFRGGVPALRRLAEGKAPR